MVRIKNRYLLVNILYPELEKNAQKTKVPNVVTFNQPTSGTLTPQDLLRAIRAEVTSLFGDFGSGAISGSLAGNWSYLKFDSYADSKIVKYLSPATSTFILRVARAHYQIVWAALSLMVVVPIKDGKNCVYRVVRVSGTIKKAEEEAIRRARELILRARRDAEANENTTLDNMFGRKDSATVATEAESTKDIFMVDRSESDDEEEMSDVG